MRPPAARWRRRSRRSGAVAAANLTAIAHLARHRVQYRRRSTRSKHRRPLPPVVCREHHAAQAKNGALPVHEATALSQGNHSGTAAGVWHERRHPALSSSIVSASVIGVHRKVVIKSARASSACSLRRLDRLPPDREAGSLVSIWRAGGVSCDSRVSPIAPVSAYRRNRLRRRVLSRSPAAAESRRCWPVWCHAGSSEDSSTMICVFMRVRSVVIALRSSG